MSALDFDWFDPDAEPPHAEKVPGGGDLIYVTWMKGSDGNDYPTPHIWHWCPIQNNWKLAGTGAHEVVAKDPLHLEPSLLLSGCCGLHGFIREGRWVPA